MYNESLGNFMGTKATKAQNNIYYQCRMNACNNNKKLNSRDGASELLGISSYSLGDYELGNTIPPADKIILMADLYNAPELFNYYCANECPIGLRTVDEIEIKEIDRTALELLYSLSSASNAKDLLLKITADGKIDTDEESDLQMVLQVLDNISKGAQQLKISLQKNKKN